MKILLSLLLIGALVSSLTGCDGNVLTNKSNSTIGDQFDNDGTPDFSFNSPLPNITSGNSSAYPVSGVCDPNGGDVTVVIGTPDVTEMIPCNSDGTFSGTLDVSTVALNPPNVDATQGTATASASPIPVNDQTGPATAPAATAPGSYVGGGSNYNLPISCNEAGEVVSISGVGIDPSPQTYTCSGFGVENFPLTLASPFETADPNNLTISSTDEYGNLSGATTMVNVPVDTQGPVVAVANGGDIVQGQTASFTVTVTDLNFSTISYTVNTSGVESSSYACNTNPCNITTGTISSTGALTLAVSANSVNDDIGNSGDSVFRSSSLTVNAAGALGFNNPLPTINTGNASSYPVSGSCDDALGNVTVNVTAPAASQSIPCTAPGNFSGTIDLSGVTTNPANVSVTQGVNTVNASPNPVNDQTPITNAPTVANQSPANGMSTNLSVNCTEAGEVLSFSGSGLNPSTQTHTCASPLSNPETVNLTFANPVETGSPNTITLSSTDSNGNPTTNSSSFSLPIDNVAPTVAVAAGADVVEGNDASFIVTVTDGSAFVAFTPTPSSGSVSSGTCASSPCAVTVSGASAGTLTLTVAIGAIVDAAGNSNTAASSDSLTIGSSTLAISEPLPTMNSTNNTAYPVSGSCDPGQGNVTITVGTPNTSESVPCNGGSFTFNGTLDVSGVTSNPPSISVSQGVNSDTPSTAPTNDQTPITNVGNVVDQSHANGASEVVSAVCTEAGETLSFSGAGLNPSPQSYTCTASGNENVTLTFANPVETGDPNTVTVNSTDVNGNPSTNPDTFNMPIDNVAPTVAVAAGADVVEGNDASFTVTVTDGSAFTGFTPSVSSGSVSSGACSSSPCAVTVAGASAGTLTMTVAIGAVVDAAGNSNTAASSDSLNVGATTLAINEPLPTANTTNNTAYPVSGNCDAGQGDVTITIGTPNTTSTVSCTGNPGAFSGTVDISSVTSDPMNVSVDQNGNTDTPTTAPVNDQTPITNAPTVADQGLSNGSSLVVSAGCNEAGEVVTFTNASLNPNPQTHTCSGAGAENVTLNFAVGQETTDPNNVTVSSVDVNGNPTTNNTTFNLPIDNVVPTVAVAAGSDIIIGATASFTVTVTDGNTFTSFTPTVSSGTVSSGVCSSSPCAVTVTGASAGTLTLTVAIGAVVDAAGNSSAAAASDSLTVNTSTLSLTEPLPVATQANASSYPVGGNCNDGAGNVTVTIGTPNATSSVACSGGTYSTTVNVSSVTSNPMSVSSEQNGNTVNASTAPENDQTPITNAPTVADQSVTNGSSTSVSVTCTEVGEVVTFTNAALSPNPQNYTCVGTTAANVTLNFAAGQETADPNNVTISSVDANGNATTNSTTFNLPIDNVAPTVAVAAGADVSAGQVASFTVTVTDGSSFVGFTPTVSSGSVSSGACSTSPCAVTVTGASAGTLTLTVAIGAVADASGNTNIVASSDSLSVTSSLDITEPLVLANLANVSSYPVSGVCDDGAGSVDIVITGSPNATVSVPCSSGTYSGNLNLANVADGNMTVTVSQNGSSSSPTTAPFKDATAIVNAPVATAPGNPIATPTYNLAINCTEADEVVTLSGGTGYSASVFTCPAAGAQTIPLTIGSNVQESPNTITISSVDVNGNPTTNDSTVNLEIDTLAPVITIVDSSNVTTANVTTYFLTGNCNEEGATVNVDFNGELMTTTPCSSGQYYTGELDVSATSDTVTYTLSASVSDASGNTGTANEVVVKDTTTPLVTLDTPVVIDNTNESSYSLGGECSENGVNVAITIGSVTAAVGCSSGLWTKGNLDVSGEADGTLAITITHSTAPTVNDSVVKDSSAASVVISRADPITSANEAVYIVSGVCTEDTVAVTVNVGNLTFNETCTGTTWSTGLIDVSSLTDDPSILVTADHSTATQASVTVVKNTVTPAIVNFVTVTSLINSADLQWGIEGDGGFTINDYEIEFKVTSDVIWLPFSDPVSTDMFATVTGLTADTSYDFRARVVYDGSNFSEWSTPDSITTKPDDPLFSSPNIAMNVGGATDTNVVAMYANTNVTINGVALPENPLAAGEIVNLTTVQFDIIDADKPIFTAGRIGSGGGAADKDNIAWSSTQLAGTEFAFVATRSNPQELIVFAIEASTVEIKQGSTLISSATIAAGVGQAMSWSVTGGFQVFSSGTILAFQSSRQGGGYYDGKVLMPAHNEILGFPSSSMWMTPIQDSTNYEILHSNSVFTSGSMDRDSSVQVSPQGTSSLFQGESMLVTSDKDIAGAAVADSNGFNAAPFIPTNLLKKVYAVNILSDWVAFASLEAGTISQYAPGDTIGVSTPVATLTLTRSGADSDAPYKVRTTNIAAGTRFVSTVPMGAWYEPDSDVGGAVEDETILIGTDYIE